MVGSPELGGASHTPEAELPTILTLGRLGSSDARLDDQHQLVVLLAFLAHNGPTDRRTVATMFWPEASTPLNSLSSALSRIRKLVPGAVEADRHQVTAHCRTDAQLMMERLARLPDDDLVVAAHGPFLAGFSIPNIGVELEEWVFDTRDAVAEGLAAAAARRCRVALEAGQDDLAEELAAYAVAFGHKLAVVVDHATMLHAILSRQGNPQAARLAELVRAETTVGGSTSSGVDTAWPGGSAAARLPDADGHHGAGAHQSEATDDSRRRELQVLGDALVPGRVVNLFGLGGVGKSWLIRQYVSEPATIGRFEKILIVDIAEAADGDVLGAEIASAFEQHGFGSGIPLPHLTQPSLLIIDSVKPSPEVLASVEALAGHENLAVLIASRLRIDHTEVDGIALRGLAVEGDQHIGPAVQLFIRAAERARADLVYDETFTAAATEICRQLAGVPLAIELTAAWLGVVPPADVLSVLDDDEILDEPPPGEDLSLARVIEQSWVLLPTDAQRGLSALSVLGPSFRRSAARQVGEVTMRGLAELRDHSLVEVDVDGRIRCHPLVQAYARRQLEDDPERHAGLLEQHRLFFIETAIAAVDPTNGHIRSAEMADLIADRHNIELAWSSMVELGRWDQVQASLPALDSLLLRSGQAHRALVLYQFALDSLGHRPSDSMPRPVEHDRLFAAVASNLAWVKMLLGDADGADELVELGLGSVGGDIATEVALRRTRCALRVNEGDGATALVGYREAQALVVPSDHPELAALLDEDIGRSLILLGDAEAAIEAFRRTLDASRRFGDVHMEARSYLMLGVARTGTDPSHALVLFSEGERLAVDHGLAHLAAYFPIDRAHALAARGDQALALAELERGIVLAEDVGDHVMRVSGELQRGRLLLRMGEPSAGALTSAFRLGIRAKLWGPVLGAALELAAHVVSADGEFAEELVGEANGVLAFALKHPLTEVVDRDRYRDSNAEGETQAALSPSIRLDEFGERLIGLVGRLHLDW